MIARRSLAVLGLTAVTLAGCKSQGVTKAPPAIQVTQVVDGGVVASFAALLDAGVQFGSVPVLEPSNATLVITNIGSGGLTLGAISVTSDGGAFAIVGTAPTQAGEPGSNLVVQFTPGVQQAFAATLTIPSDDPANPSVSIPLSGTGATEGLLSVAPNPLAFGGVGQGQTQTMTLTLTSDGTAPLFVSAIGLADGSDPAYAFVSSVTLDGGLTLSNVTPNNTLPLTLSFSPTDTTPASPTGSVVIVSSDPNNRTTVVPLTGSTVLAPIPSISVPTSVPVDSLLTLDGSGSSDPNNPPLLPLTYQWALVQKPLGSQATISDVTAEKPTLTADVAGYYDVQLDVTNDAGIQDVAPAHASIDAEPLDDLYVEMVWDNDPIDMDLHFLGPGATLGGPGDCTPYNPDAGFSCVPSSDHLLGPGPEYVTVDSPEDGTYTVACVLYASHNATSLTTNVTVRIYLYGILSSQLTQSVDQVGATWTAATIAWPSGTITPSTTVTP